MKARMIEQRFEGCKENRFASRHLRAQLQVRSQSHYHIPLTTTGVRRGDRARLCRASMVIKCQGPMCGTRRGIDRQVGYNGDRGSHRGGNVRADRIQCTEMTPRHAAGQPHKARVAMQSHAAAQIQRIRQHKCQHPTLDADGVRAREHRVPHAHG